MAALAIFILGMLADVPAPQARPAWQWTTEDRIASRTDAAAARERVAAKRRRVAANASAHEIADDFNGRTNPELFLPHEVFRFFISIAFLSDPRTQESFRAAMKDDLAQHDLPADFWQRFEALALVHINHERRTADLARSSEGAREARTLANTEACRSRVDALAEARSAFGAERFDRFLYEAVASGMFHVADELPDPQKLREAARGCR